MTVPGRIDPHADPTARASGGWIARVSMTHVGIWVGMYGPIQVLLGLQAAAFTPDHKEATLGLVTGAGALVSVVATPIFGALSDRTTHRLGRRVPWVLVGALGGAGSLILLAFAPHVAAMVLGWCLVQGFLHASLAGILAAVPDQVPVDQRATVSGWLGVNQTLGVVLGTGVAASIGGVRTGYLACAVLLLACTVPYALRSNDLRLTDRPAPIRWRAFVKSLWVSPREHPDFAWAWITRFLVMLSNGIGLLYLLYFLTDVVRREDPAADLFVLTLLYAGCLIATAVAAGTWSDRCGRRKIFVVASGLVMAVAALVLALMPTWTGALIGSVLLGTGFGVYMAVDFALITQVLPHATDRAKDLGVVTIAASLPAVLAPVVAAPIVSAFADKTMGYRVLYVVAGGIGLLGTVLVGRIRSVD
ncbi:MFS transporter [Demetria terragena]|uniref:MFS transporter n=1 Tax=Demetria terragena TaxID=63959 RepID=UPI0003722B1C|nr:MFS transporter [Demetria terragena]